MTRLVLQGQDPSLLEVQRMASPSLGRNICAEVHSLSRASGTNLLEWKYTYDKLQRRLE